MDISLRQLEAFVSTVDNGGFSKAAEALFLSQSTVSCHIAQLESVLKVSLLERRNKRNIELTQEGWSAYRMAKEILEKCRVMEDTFLQAEGRDTVLSLAASSVPMSSIVPRLMTEYAQIHPTSKFSVHEGDSAAALERLKQGKVTFSFVGTKQKDSAFAYHKLCKDRIVLIAPNNEAFLQKKQAGYSGEELLSSPIIMREPGSGTRAETDEFLKNLGLAVSELSVIAQMNDQESVKKAVINGLGITLISERAAQDVINEQKVLKFPLNSNNFYRYLYFVHEKDKSFTAQEQSFINFVKKSASAWERQEGV